MPTRYDVTQVPLQGGYVAKTCPVVAQNNTLLPVEPIPPSPFGQKLIESGRVFEAEIFAELIALHPHAVVIEGEGAAREDSTLAAMQQQAPLIIGGRLPADQVGRREGRPDLLVAAHGGGYHAIDVKWHQSLEPATGGKSELPGRCSSLSAPGLDQALLDEASPAGTKWCHRLPHHYRHGGVAASSIGRVVLGKESTMWGRAVVGFLLCAVGAVWILQGMNVIQGSGMSGSSLWGIIGAVVVVVGLGFFVWAGKHRVQPAK